ncbi:MULTISPECIES: filamentous hemagglutinin N-terminal domain-containing protein [unclassified Coleofasciculus]|uniref:two-partner secretion domain-containing protein n=1 Tax=unclassified Coleofasciculus TaxID=2692782 RepID=UPI001882BAC9|nr:MULTISPECIES: filamentous hemagglutinin N-terminal domain-containing protein [unclassified Coleofasciculus]MBE9129121.1 filamentous hemagglutinin N-terminal domain-containing protein [Coleofasciculus sp. LEGE 07081]MBE9149775.1 filamentous hemagglutinin N-terminal domain-containing protein [Coleofasciculus sp. LEGE 07092]
MSKKLKIAGVVAWSGLIAGTAQPTLAQITPDTTLGIEESVVTPNVTIKGLSADLIEGGAQREANLFHSFSDFNVQQQQRVYFANPIGIENIFSRITGSQVSKILGTLGVNGGANLYLLNPNGIIFGANAKLDVPGSFAASTDNSIIFGNGVEFSATNPEAPPLLAINVTPGLQYGQVNPKSAIASTGNLAAGEDLTLIGSNLKVQGSLQAGRNLTLIAADTVQVRDTTSNPFIAAAGNRLFIEGVNRLGIFALNHAESGLFAGGDLVLRSGNTVTGDAHYTTGGNFRLEQLDGTPGMLKSPNDPVIRASGDVILGGYQGVSLHIFAGGSVTIPGGVFITGSDVQDGIEENITLSDGTTVSINGKTQPTLDIRAGTTAVGSPGIEDTPPPSGVIVPPFPNPIGAATSADITIGGIVNQGGVVYLTNQYQPNLSLPGGTITVNGVTTVPGVTGAITTANPMGNGGSVTIDSRGSIALNDLVNTSGLVQAGDIRLLANGDITVSEILSLGSLGGAITFTSNSTISVSDRLITSVSTSPIPGTTGGDININARSLLLKDGARIIVATLGAAQGGNMNVTTSESVDVTGVSSNPTDNSLATFLATFLPEAQVSGAQGLLIQNPGSGLYAITALGTGDTGNVNITTERLSVREGAEASTFTFGQGSGGNLTVNASDVELIDISPMNVGGLFSESQGIGDAGNLLINTERLIVQGGQNISTSTRNQGQGGNLTVNASESVELSGISVDGQSASLLAAATLGTGDAGDMTINTRRLTLRDGALVAAPTLGQGNGGKLTVNASESVEVIGKSPINVIPSSIATDTFNTLSNPTNAGNAGDLTINTRRLSVRDGGLVTVSTWGDGAGGSLVVNASESVELSGKSDTGFPSGLYSQGFGSGNAGNLQVNTEQLTVRDEARVTAATGTTTSDLSVPSGTLTFGNVAGLILPTQATGNAGMITIAANSIRLDNKGSLIARTVSGEGGNIDLEARDFIEMRRNSLISAEALGGNGNGGNVTIDTQFLVAVSEENSDIVADAFGGDGGNINITAQSIFGLEFRPQRTPNSDITASSRFGLNGDVNLNTPEVDPSSGLSQLPSEPIDVEGLVDRTCQADAQQNASEFVVTGRGGLPQQPNQPLVSEATIADWVPLESETDGQPDVVSATPTKESPVKTIVEAQGWTVDQQGNVVLTAVASEVTPQRPGFNPSSCKGL